MAFDLTPEQKDLQRYVRSFLNAAPMNAPGEPECSPATWRGLRDMGLVGIPFPDRVGGFGGTIRDAAVVTEELGRVLSSAPYFSTVALAGLTLGAADTDGLASVVLKSIAEEGITASLVTGYPYSRTSISATELEGEVVLDGTQDYVVDGEFADLLVVVAHGAHGLELALVKPDEPGLTRSRMVVLDETRALSRIEFSGVRGFRISNAPDLPERLDRAQSESLILLAAEQIGAAEACLEMSVEYAKTRHQFGRPIGSYQAIKHLLADILIALELARVAVLDATDSVDRTNQELHVAASVARLLASRAFTFAAEESIHVHGGTGFTWEHRLHRYFRRAKADELLFGSQAMHRENIARLLGFDEPPGFRAAAAAH